MINTERLERYEYLKTLLREGQVIGPENEEFVRTVAWEKLQGVLSDPEVMKIFERLKEK